MIVGEQIEEESSCTEDLFLLSFYLVIQARTAQDPAYRSGFTFIKFFLYHWSYTCLFVCHFFNKHFPLAHWNPLFIPCLQSNPPRAWLTLPHIDADSCFAGSQARHPTGKPLSLFRPLPPSQRKFMQKVYVLDIFTKIKLEFIRYNG